MHPFAHPGQPEVLIVSNIQENGKPIGLGDAGVFGHSDLSYKERPSLGSFLHAQELPAEGGDTLFANQHLAWEELPADLRSAVQGERAEHSDLKVYGQRQRRSPWRPNLLPEQSAALPQTLYAHSTQGHYIYRPRWLPGDMVFWDHRSVLHLAAACPPDQPPAVAHHDRRPCAVLARNALAAVPPPGEPCRPVCARSPASTTTHSPYARAP